MRRYKGILTRLCLFCKSTNHPQPTTQTYYKFFSQISLTNTNCNKNLSFRAFSSIHVVENSDGYDDTSTSVTSSFYDGNDSDEDENGIPKNKQKFQNKGTIDKNGRKDLGGKSQRWSKDYRKRADEVLSKNPQKNRRENIPKNGRENIKNLNLRSGKENAIKNHGKISQNHGKIPQNQGKMYQNHGNVSREDGKKTPDGKTLPQGEISEEDENEDEDDNVGELDESMEGCFTPLNPDEKQQKILALQKAFLEVSLEPPDLGEINDDVDSDDDEYMEQKNLVPREDQRSLSVAIIGAPNSGKSTLTNRLVGTKVSAVSRKTNTTNHEILGVLSKGETQVLFFDTPGLQFRHSAVPYPSDVVNKVESCWKNIGLYDMVVVLIDIHRHILRPDPRVIKIVEKAGEESHSSQKRVLCLNKVDLVEQKKDLLVAANEFGKLPGYDKFFMISGEKGSGVKDLANYLLDQAVKRPWDEDPVMDEEYVKNLAYEVVREKMLDSIHQEIPYCMDQRIIGLKFLKDGSLRIEQHFIVNKQGHRKIVIGKRGSKIMQIGMAANEELRKLLGRTVHLILQVRVKSLR